jgi:rSAM/selenodomain-associated transferase 1
VTPALVVIAKAPLPGRSKTRLCPPCTPHEAAALAKAALRDTLAAVLAVRGDVRRVLVLDGAPGPWLPARGIEVVAQRGAGLGARLAAAFADVGGPAFLVGMDTPQVTPALLAAGVDAVRHATAALGRAPDGGYWGIGLRVADAAVFARVPMSSSRTGAVQLARLRARGHEPLLLPVLRDVDTIADARAVAALAPASRFAAALGDVEQRLAVRRPEAA